MSASSHRWFAPIKETRAPKIECAGSIATGLLSPAAARLISLL
jgi:hypothetical protein